MLRRSVHFYLERSDGRARSLFRASLMYLMFVLGLLVIDRGPIDWLDATARAEASPPPAAVAGMRRAADR